MLWLKQFLHAQNPSNVAEFKKRSDSDVKYCYHWDLTEVVESKGDANSS